jgi:hypothetical protein
VNEWTRVSTAAELADAVAQRVPAIEVGGVVRGMPMVTLAPGVRLRGGTLEFGARGVRLTTDNLLEEVTIRCPGHEAAVLNDTSVPGLGVLTLRGVRTSGQVLLLARDAVRSGHVQVDGLTVETADVRGRFHRPHGFGVDALQGAFTLWNQQPNPAVEITAELLDISVGSADHPVRGSGVFAGGHGDWSGAAEGGTVHVTRLCTGEIHSDAGIPVGTPDLISGGVFVIFGVVADEVLNAAPVTTYGPNDMVLDNWGLVRSWVAIAPVTSHGPGSIGFVNFGNLDRLDIRAAITTHGTGARGFNLYDGSVRHASFSSITTTGDGAVGIQASKRIGLLDLRGDLTTSGGEGRSLVQGDQTMLKAIALSVKPGGKIGKLASKGRIATSGDDVVTVEIDGEIGAMDVAGGITAQGARSDAVHVRGDVPGLAGISVKSAHGEPVVRRAPAAI